MPHPAPGPRVLKVGLDGAPKSFRAAMSGSIAGCALDPSFATERAAAYRTFGSTAFSDSTRAAASLFATCAARSFGAAIANATALSSSAISSKMHDRLPKWHTCPLQTLMKACRNCVRKHSSDPSTFKTSNRRSKSKIVPLLTQRVFVDPKSRRAFSRSHALLRDPWPG